MRSIVFIILSFFLSSLAFSQNEKQIIANHIKELNPNASWEITSQASSNAIGVKHYYLRQTINELPIANAVGLASVKGNELVHFNFNIKSFEAPSIIPSLNAEATVRASFQLLGIAAATELTKIETTEKNTFAFLCADTKTKIPVALNYFVHPTKGILLAWNLSIEDKENHNWWSLQMDAQSGDLLFKNNWVLNCSFENCNHKTDEHQEVLQMQSTANVLNGSIAMAPPPPPVGVSQYLVYPFPIESPSFGAQTLIIDPADPIASPFGWHDVDGLVGPDFTVTIGNNVFAAEDIANLDAPGISPSGGVGPDLTFNSPMNPNVPSVQNLEAATTNLFYANNMMHDIFHYHGFDEASGNFQTNNYSNNGVGDDAVFAQSQDGSGTNNANMGTPPEGFSPSMQMYIWNDPNLTNILSITSPANLAMNYGGSIGSFDGGIPNPVFGEFVLLEDGEGPELNDGCSAAVNSIAGKIAIMRRGGCTFVEKIELAQSQGAIGVVVVNNAPNGVIAMGGNDPGTIYIPSVMITQADGQQLIDHILAGNVLSGSLQGASGLLDRDSDFDNGIIAHEYAHGISNRLVGGADNVNCLGNEEQMGEGWSDYYALMVTLKSTDQANNARAMATYASFQPTNGGGIRPAPYSRSFGVNNYTYAQTNNLSVSQPHGIGFIWASMLYDMTWDLIDQYGFTANIKTGVGGNTIAMKLVTEGLKLSNCSPGFVDGRDAILAADQILYNGANKCLIWKAFARRGLGYTASQGDAGSRQDQIEAFDLPNSCLPGVSLSSSELQFASVFPNPTDKNVSIVFNTIGLEKTVQVFDLRGTLLKTVKSTQNELEISLESLAKGTYLIEVSDAKEKHTFEVIRN